MAAYPHTFEGPLDRFGVGRERKVWYNVLFLPDELAATLPFDRHPRLRVEGELAELPIAGAWMPTGDARRYIIVPARIIKEAEIRIGDMVEMRFAIADQDAVDMPPELTHALATDPEASDAWSTATPGRRRGLTHRIHGAKSPATRARRVTEVLAILRGE